MRFSLNHYSQKKILFLFAAVFSTILIWVHFLDLQNQVSINNLNLYCLVSLLAAIGCKDKIEDERSKAIRYFSFKLSFMFMISISAACSILEFIPQNIYVAIIGCVFYLLVYLLCSHFNPSFIFTERESKRKVNPNIIYAIMSMAIIIFFYNHHALLFNH